ncbi:MAG: carbamoyl-phosphate synthase large subunit [Candidatus Omnitrophica bacterium]|nr:carbamoyl-phosphate synthase large subunit [Candidatus Omnitrophota bacterium]MCB9783223.1 carbamoyl-phosphate synthase large subunit [Candidatus Omnitrophota bacterium]
MGQLPNEKRVQLWEAKKNGFSDVQISHLLGISEEEVRELRIENGVVPVFKLVDTCAGEFEAYTPYYYSCYESPVLSIGEDGQPNSLNESEIRKSDKPTVMILGGGANRIGQGIEFDYCCCHAAFALRDAGYDTVMVNSNPETVSTDYDTSTRLYFEPLTFENVMNIIEVEKPVGVIVQFGGQTPLNLATRLEEAGAPIIGTSPASIDRTEDRKSFGAFLDELGISQPAGGTATNFDEAVEVARSIGFPVLVRPSFVLGGRAMEIVFDEESLKKYIARAAEVSPGKPILIDRFLDGAIEVDVDAICDGDIAVVGGIMEHIEQAGIHSGDSACVLPPRSLSPKILKEIRENTEKLALGLEVKGLMNVQYAVQYTDEHPEGKLFVIEVNPRASRTVPFVSKATGVPLARLASLVMIGKSLKELGFTEEPKIDYFCVKEAVLPFIKFTDVDPLLGPEMRSTGEVMGIADNFGVAFAKSQAAAGQNLPLPPKPGETRKAFLSVNNRHKKNLVSLAKNLRELGFNLVCTEGTGEALAEEGIESEFVYKVHEGRPNIVDRIKNKEIDFVINTPLGAASKFDETAIRRAALENSLPYVTTISAAEVTVQALKHLGTEEIRKVRSLQEWHRAAD